MTTPIRRRLVALTLVVTFALTGCATSYPADPDGTLDRVTGGTLRVGVSPNGDWTVTGDGDDPSGIEVTLIEQFADTLDAEIDWTEGGEERLLTDLEDGELDLVIGGFTDQTPWSEKAAITKPFAEVDTTDGTTEKHVMATAMGENAFLLELEQFLLNREDAP